MRTETCVFCEEEAEFDYGKVDENDDFYCDDCIQDIDDLDLEDEL